ncbi:MAG TPA: bifunctional serine/threonine-protein kinase/formylglycine-generating enzyme family protein [Pirellulales bacterium]|nr:bifunctional serine/threonine-protein kinase/formylglycine-generating enzyme family protein [Pirellulales bacterium]
MAVAVEQFVKGLEQSGIISPSNLRALREKLPPERQHDAQEVARELVRRKVLTTYQVKEAYQGKAKDLVLGNYVILDQIGQGGMGQVFKARHRRMDRIVAIKMLPAGVSNDPGAVARFQREVKAAAKLEHPNIVTAYDADEAAGRHFLVMQYVEGTDLSALVKKNGPFPVAEAVSYVLQAARGLEFAHGEGVVHRDVKPANLLVDKKGVVKVLDMGLARLESAAGVEHTELTGTGQIMGTVDYMSPEQALDTKHADERSDVYSLGCTLWYLLTGRAAFGGESVMAKLLAHREQPIPSLQAACAEATPALQAVFTKMVAKKAEDRFQSMSEVVAELERFRLDRDAVGSASEVSDAPGEDHRLSEFLRGMNPSKAAGGHAPSKPAPATKRPSPPLLEATMAMTGPQVDTDPTTEQSLVAPAAVAWWKKVAEFVRIPSVKAQRRNSHEFRHMRGRRSVSGGGRRIRVFVACAAGASALLLAGIVLFLQTKQGTLRIEINDPAIEVVVDGKGATIKGAKSEEIKLQPGNHGLRIKYGELEFETNKFILNRGDTITLKVELLAGKVRVVQGDTVLGEAPLPAIAPFDAKQAGAYQEAWAKYLGTKVEIENSLGMKLRLIPPGEFTMGSPQAEIDALVETTTDQNWQVRFRSEGPRHPVKLTQAFYLCSCEVTQRQYQELMGVNPSYFSSGGAGKDAVKDLDTREYPVETVSWFDAIDFCNKLSEKEQRKPYYVRDGEVVKVLGGTGYRLPTEAEWEYACRAGTTTRWSFGDNETNFAQHAWFNSNSSGRTHQVEGLPSNPFGLYDLYGNAWEWCWDWHGEYAAGAVSDPTGPAAGSARVVRGGAFYSSASYCRCAARFAAPPMDRDLNLGFRVLCGR